MAVVYRHIRLDNGLPFYIGIGKKEERAYSKNGRTEYWHKIVKKCGFEVEILFDDISYEMAKIKEIEFIKLYGRANINSGILCNLTDGGQGSSGYKHSSETITKLKNIAKNRTEETYKKISISNSNKIVPIETKLKISLATIGEKNHFYGKKHSKESKKIISEKAKGRKLSNDVKLKISQSLKGENNYWYNKKLSDEHKKKLSEIAMGRKLSDELKEKIRLNSPKRIEIYRFINNEIYIFKSFSEAEILTGISRKIIKKKFNDLGFLNKEEAILKGLIINN